MKIHKIILVFLIAAIALTSYSCQEEDERFIHTDTTITAIYIRDEVGGVYVQGTLKGEKEIVFEIPLASRTKLDITNILIYANIPVSAHVSPGFAGRHDLSSPKEFSVINDNNVPFTYILKAVYLEY